MAVVLTLPLGRWLRVKFGQEPFQIHLEVMAKLFRAEAAVVSTSCTVMLHVMRLADMSKDYFCRIAG